MLLMNGVTIVWRAWKRSEKHCRNTKGWFWTRWPKWQKNYESKEYGQGCEIGGILYALRGTEECKEKNDRDIVEILKDDYGFLPRVKIMQQDMVTQNPLSK